MTSFRRLAFLIFAAVVGVNASGSGTGHKANPIRRVVNMLQMMQKQVEKEGKEEEKLYEKFMCYCKTGTGELEASIAAAETKIPQVEAALKSAEELFKQLDEELKQHKQDQADAEEALASATEQRKKEKKAYDKMSTDYTANILAMGKAIAAIEKGSQVEKVKGFGFMQTYLQTFLQSAEARALKKLTIDMDMNSMDRDVVSAFLANSHSDGYAPQSGQIVGILKQMKDTMQKDLSDAIAAEEAAIKDFEILVKAKTKELKATTMAIESKTERHGETEVNIVNLKEDLDDTQKSLAADKKFLAELTKGCQTKDAEWEARCKLRSEELLALADTIKILNDDDALELFKKTLPAPSLLQVQVTSKELAKAAGKALNKQRGHVRDHRIDLISMAIAGTGRGRGTFDKVIGMIDAMVKLLGKEQKDDDNKKAWCEKELDKAEDEFKVLNEKLEDLEKAIEETKENIATLTDEIAALTKGVKELDADVTEATNTRKEENEFYKKTMAEDTATMDILKMAKNRLAKFYTPKLYKAPAKKELSEAGAIERDFSFVQVTAHSQAAAEKSDAAPPPPPETWDAYQKKGEENAGVTEMMQLLMTDLEKDMTELTTNEKEDQAEYETFIADAAAKRKEDTQSIENKDAAKADAEARLEKLSSEKATTLKASYAMSEEIKELHLDCDWLLANFENRKAARAGEVESLKNAKAVLSGADYSLLQTGVARLRGTEMRA